MRKFRCEVEKTNTYTIEINDEFWDEEKIKIYAGLYEDGYIETIEDFVRHVCHNDIEGITEFQPLNDNCDIFLSRTKWAGGVEEIIEDINDNETKMF